jgi:hypothetical protein
MTGIITISLTLIIIVYWSAFLDLKTSYPMHTLTNVALAITVNITSAFFAVAGILSTWVMFIIF